MTREHNINRNGGTETESETDSSSSAGGDEELTEGEKRQIFRQGRVGRAILKLDERQRKRRDRRRDR